MSNRVIGVVASIVAMFYVGGTIASAQGRHRTDQKIGHTIMFEKPTVMGPGRGFTRRLDSQQHAGPGSRFVFSPDGKYLASVLSEWFPAGIDLKTGKKLAAPKGRVLLWNLEDAKVERTWMHDHDIWRIAFSAKGGVLLGACEDGVVKLWRMPDGAVLDTWDNPVNKLQKIGAITRRSKRNLGITDLAVSPRGKTVATCAWLPTLWDWDTKKATILDLQVDTRDARAIKAVFSSDGEKLFVVPAGRRLSAWSTKTGRLLTQVKHLSGGLIIDIASSPHGRVLATVESMGPLPEDQGWIRLWDAESLTEISAVRAFDHGGECVTFSPDGKYLIAGGHSTGVNDPGLVCIWEVATGKNVAAHSVTDKGFLSLAISPDGKTLATRGSEPAIRLHDFEALLGKKTP